MLITGSTALAHWFPEVRKPKDLDIINPETPVYLAPKTEVHWNAAFNYLFEYNKDPLYVDPNFLYTIKVSHAAWDVRWDKTMMDIMFLKSKGCTLDKKLYKQLYKEWEVIHFPKRLSLDKTNEEFFQPDRLANHDKLHEHFMFGSRPMHERIRLDLSRALTNRALWEALPYEDKIKTCLEEIYVIAVERFIDKCSPLQSFNKSIKTLIVSATKGYFCLFMIENFDKLISADKNHYLTKLKELKNANP